MRSIMTLPAAVAAGDEVTLTLPAVDRLVSVTRSRPDAEIESRSAEIVPSERGPPVALNELLRPKAPVARV